MNSIRRFLITGLGLGYLPGAPGTFGSAGAAGVFALTASISPEPICVSGAMALIAIFFSLVCVRLGPFAEKAFGRKDPSQCTADEWAGQGVAFLGLPIAAGGTWITCLVGFAAFRVFDIVKPPPIRRLERLPQGWGVLADDLAAGVCANIVGQLVLRLWLVS